MSGKTFTEDEVRAASGLSEASWSVYINAGRYAQFLANGSSGWTVTADEHLSEEDFHAQVTQSKSGGLQSRTYQTRYMLSRVPLGVGGFAEVFRATNRADSTQVALKRAKENNTARQRIDREIETMSRLSHDNIMPAVDYDDTRLWYTMPLAIRTLVRDGRFPDSPVPLEQMVQDVLAALEFSHLRHSLVHRDVAPGNIVQIETSGFTRWVLSDWGIVRQPKGQTTALYTRAGAPLGTDQFAAPELWSNAHDADYRADFYGLGRVVAWLLGCSLIPNVPSIPGGEWADFVRALTVTNVDERPLTHDDVRRLIPHPLHASRAVLVREIEPNQNTIEQRRSRPGNVDLEGIVESALDDYVADLVNSDDVITSLIAGTNAAGYYADEIEILSAGPLDLLKARIPFVAAVHLSGEQDPDSMFSGDAITATLHGELGHDGETWQIEDCEVRDARIDDYSE
jgi:serine/threonine protein kinase